MLCGAFVSGRNERMKDELANRDEPESFEALVNLAIRKGGSTSVHAAPWTSPFPVTAHT